MRGVIRKKHGQSLIQIIQEEPAVFISSFVRDLADAGVSVRDELVGGALKGFLGALFGGGR